MKVLPYVYKAVNKESNEFYIGVRWGNKVPSNQDLGIKYFTSSKRVKPISEEFDYFVLAEFFNKDDAIQYEQDLIEENWTDPLLLNKAIQVSKHFKCEGHTPETCEKISNAHKGREHWNKGKKLSKEHRQKLSIAAAKQTHSEETKEKIRKKALGNKRGLGNKSRTGYKTSEETKSVDS